MRPYDLSTSRYSCLREETTAARTPCFSIEVSWLSRLSLPQIKPHLRAEDALRTNAVGLFARFRVPKHA